MAFLNVIPPAQIPLPSLRGMGAPRIVRTRGMGQAASSAAEYLAQAFAAMPPVATAMMLLNTPSPSGAVLSALYINSATSPSEAAQVVYDLASEFCGQQQDTAIFGGTPPADCANNGQAAAAAAYPQWLAYYSSLPASVWTSGTVSPQQANPQVFMTADPIVTPAASVPFQFGPVPASQILAQAINGVTSTPASSNGASGGSGNSGGGGSPAATLSTPSFLSDGSCPTGQFGSPGIPLLGCVDPTNPLDLAIVGGAIAGVALAPGIWKAIVPLGLLLLRQQLGKISF